MHKRWVMLALALLPSARAAADEPRVGFQVVEYDAPRACPSRSHFERRVADRLAAGGSSLRRAARVRVVLRAAAGAARGTVTIEAGASRSLEGASCREVAEGLALITALALTEQPALSARGTPTESPVARSSAEPVRDVADQPLVGSGAEVPPLERAADAAAQSGAKPQRTASGQAAAVSVGAQVAAANSGERPAAEKPAPHASASEVQATSLRLVAGVLAFHGLAPRLQPGLQLGAALVQGFGAWELSAQVMGRLALRQTLESAAGEAHFGFVGGALALCAAAGLGRTGLWLRGCGTAEAGVLQWSATQTEQAQAYARGWLALGPAGTLWWRGKWLGVGAGAELLWPTRRDRALLAGEVLQRVPAACLRLQMGLELSFEAGP